ncbi:INO80 complex subunit E [Gastrophryne carolinensis]
MNGQADDEVDYKRKYKNLKRKLKFLIYEQECFQEELRRAQRKLLKVSRDKSSPLTPSCTPTIHPAPTGHHPMPLGSPPGGGVLPFSPRSSGLLPLTSSSKHAPPPTILSTVPQQMFSDGGEGSGDDGPLDGDEEDDLVIDIPE